ncbi:MAG: SWF/SNF helicase family protein [Desulfobacterales bacterium]|nr:SWF/SNF helicase family protein [Desulfobacterales bacterium]
MNSVDPAEYDLRKLHEAVQHDVDVLSEIWHRVKDIGPESDAKLTRLEELLSKELRGRKVLVFSYYRDTARYIYKQLTKEDRGAPRRKLRDVTLRRMDSDSSPKVRVRVIQEFSPKSNKKPELVGTDKEIDILISTDVLSEGQNLQDCGHLVNYDLHWNPTRMVQRAGRIDRIGTEFDTLWIYNMFPEKGLEKLLGLVESLSRKIEAIDSAGFLDASILGETVHPQNFNTLRRIRDEDGNVIEEEEQFTELASSEFMLQQLRNLLGEGGREMLEWLPDGIHSGLVKEGAKGVFFYFQAEPRGHGKIHFWKYWDLNGERFMDNRYLIANLIACERETTRVVDQEIFRSIFELQDLAMEDILKSFQDKQALEIAPKAVDPLQQTLATLLQSYMNHPAVERKSAIETIRFLNQPMLQVQVKELRKIYRDFQNETDIIKLVSDLEELRSRTVSPDLEQRNTEHTSKIRLNRSDLKLICFDILTS